MWNHHYCYSSSSDKIYVFLLIFKYLNRINIEIIEWWNLVPKLQNTNPMNSLNTIIPNFNNLSMIKVTIFINTGKFMSTILKSLENALIKARRGEFESALIHLANSEKVLEYGANCGKIIDRKLIITVLHNEAFCYQRIGERLKALKYIEAINYNLRSHITSL